MNNWLDPVNIACDLIVATAFSLTPWQLWKLALYKRIGYVLGTNSFLALSGTMFACAIYRVCNAINTFINPPQNSLYFYDLTITNVMSAAMATVMAITLFLRGRQILNQNGSVLDSAIEAMQRELKAERGDSPARSDK